MLATLENQDYEELANEVQKIADTKSEDSLYAVLGNALYNSGLEVAPYDYPEAVMAITSIKSKHKVDFIKTIDFVGNAVPMAKIDAKEQGKGFFQRIKKEICTNEKIREFFTGKSALADHLKIIIPIILGLISSSLALGPIGLAIVITILALILKVGYQTYCDI